MNDDTDEMNTTASRLFSKVAEGHAQFRPDYPDMLLDYLASVAPHRQRAWDCACGSGRATQGLERCIFRHRH